MLLLLKKHQLEGCLEIYQKVLVYLETLSQKVYLEMEQELDSSET